ncbi:MAG: hypothetical protein ACOX1S_05380 [Anaerostipes sp.]|nr:hypothetical protein [Anaerostipes sp.]
MEYDDIKVGDKVKYYGCDRYGNEFRVSKDMKYKILFGTKTYTVKETRFDCCNTILTIVGLDGAYNSKLFRLEK